MACHNLTFFLNGNFYPKPTVTCQSAVSHRCQAVLRPSLFVYNVNTVLSVFNIYLLLEQWQNLNIVEYV